ncbi:MAG: type II toxin-antitoxin system RelE/ParE family toxin [Fimbriiglobus sp.]
MTPNVHREANAEFLEAARYHLRQSLPLGNDLKAAWDDGLREIAADPRRYAIADDAPDGADVRCYTITRFHYRLLYLVEGHTLTVLAFAHARRRPGYWANRLP